MHKLKKQELKQKTKNVKNSWFDWLINYVPKPTKKLQMILKINFQWKKKQAHQKCKKNSKTKHLKA